MGYIRVNIYQATCDKQLNSYCKTKGVPSETIERALSNACEDGWKRIGIAREMICPECLKHIQGHNKILGIQSRN